MRRRAFAIIKSAGKLPSPTGAALEVLRLSQREDTRIDEIVSVIEVDPAAAGRILRYVNSPFAGLARRVTSISAAVVLLGVKTVARLALGFSLIAENRRGGCPEFPYEEFWSECVARGVAARHVAHRLAGIQPDEAFACAFLGQIGRLTFATVFPESYAQILRDSETDAPERLFDLERDMFDLDHNELAAEMMVEWGLPETCCQAVQHQDRPDDIGERSNPILAPLARLLYLAGLISGLLVRRHASRDSVSSAVNQANRLSVRPDAFADVFDLIATEWRVLSEVLDVSCRLVPPLAEVYAQARERRAALRSC